MWPSFSVIILWQQGFEVIEAQQDLVFCSQHLKLPEADLGTTARFLIVKPRQVQQTMIHVQKWTIPAATLDHWLMFSLFTAFFHCPPVRFILQHTQINLVKYTMREKGEQYINIHSLNQTIWDLFFL